MSIDNAFTHQLTGGSAKSANRLLKPVRPLLRRWLRAVSVGGFSGQSFGFQPLAIVVKSFLRFLIVGQFVLHGLESPVGSLHGLARGSSVKHQVLLSGCRHPEFRRLVVAGCVPSMIGVCSLTASRTNGFSAKRTRHSWGTAACVAIRRLFRDRLLALLTEGYGDGWGSPCFLRLFGFPQYAKALHVFSYRDRVFLYVRHRAYALFPRQPLPVGACDANRR